MIVKRYVKKSTIYIIAAVMALLTAGALYLGVVHRFTYGAKYKNYTTWSAQVLSLKEYKHEDSNDNVYYHYSAFLTYNVNGTVYTPVTDEVFTEEDVPMEGEKIPIFYNNSDPDDYVLVKYDWLTKSYIPLSDKGDVWLFTAFLLLGFVLLLIPMNLENDQVQGVMIGSGLLLFGLDGIVNGYYYAQISNVLPGYLWYLRRHYPVPLPLYSKGETPAGGCGICIPAAVQGC